MEVHRSSLRVRIGTMKVLALARYVVSGSSKEMVFIWKAMRPADWIKNVFVFAPLFFSGQATQGNKLQLTVLVFLAFSAMSSAVYLFNDINDRELDRLHPQKRFRPIASGALSVRLAGASAMMLAIISLGLVSFSPGVVVFLLAYGVMNIAYSLWLKHVVIGDVFCIGLGFVFRVWGGGIAIDVMPSSWLILATFLLSLVLALAKRRHELLVLETTANTHRPVLEQYSLKLVDELISVVTPVTLITYILYTLDAGTIARFHSNLLYLTSIFVVFGIFRYLYLVHRMNLGGSPVQLLMQDVPLSLAIVGWVVTFFLIVYVA